MIGSLSRVVPEDRIDHGVFCLTEMDCKGPKGRKMPTISRRKYQES